MLYSFTPIFKNNNWNKNSIDAFGTKLDTTVKWIQSLENYKDGQYISHVQTKDHREKNTEENKEQTNMWHTMKSLETHFTGLLEKEKK